MWKLVTLILLVTLSATVDSRAQGTLEERTAMALSRNYETVFGVDGALVTKSELSALTHETQAIILSRPYHLLIAGLKSSDKHVLGKLSNGNAKVLLGARNFRPPQGLGMIVAHYCYVLIYDDSQVPDWNRVFAGSIKVRAEGKLWWKWSAKLNEFGEEDRRESTFFATKGDGPYILITNTLSQLKTLVGIDAQIKNTSGGQNAEGDLKTLLEHRMWGWRDLQLTQNDSLDIVPQCILSNFDRLAFYTDFAGNNYYTRVTTKADNTDYPPCFVKSPSTAPFVHRRKNMWESQDEFANDLNDSKLRSVIVLLGFGGAY